MGFAEAAAAPEVAWSLVDAGMQVTVFARKGQRSALRHSRYVTCREIAPPESNVEATLADLADVMRATASSVDGPALLFPLDDTAVWLCNNVGRGQHWILAGPSGPTAVLALDKRRQVELAREAGFNVPPSCQVHSANDIQAFAATAGFPLILKASECVSIFEGRQLSSRNWICADAAELRQAIEEWDARVPLLAQRFIPGTGEGVFGIATADGVRAWSAHRRLRMMNPHGSGASACVSTPVQVETQQRVSALMAKADWRGLFMVELLRDPDGKLWFVELNGRPWGSMALARRQGLEYPAWHIELALDEHSSAGLAAAPVGGVVCRNVGRELMHLAFVLRGPRSSAQRTWPRFWKSFIDVAAIRSSDRIYNWRRSDWRVLLADIYYTVSKNVFKARH